MDEKQDEDRIASDGDDPDAPPRPFEELLDEAAELAESLESRSLPLEEALDAYARGVRALKACAKRLSGVEERARVLMADGGAWRLAALDGNENEGEDGDEDNENGADADEGDEDADDTDAF